MDLNESLTDYLTRKTQIKNFNCEFSSKERCNECGSCFWYNITIKPLINIPKCSNCLKDMLLFKELNESTHMTIELKSQCCIHCIWFDWFHRQRISQLRRDKKLIYNWGKKK